MSNQDAQAKIESNDVSPLDVLGDVPLCVDLDGTLIFSDTLAESFCVLLKEQTPVLFLLPIWLLRGRAHLKREIAKRTRLVPSSLPFNQEVVSFVREESEKGRRVVLVTAADEEIGKSIAAEVGLFSEVFGSVGSTNLKSEHKARFLVDRYGEGCFDYIGNSSADLAVWKVAREAHVVTDGSSLLKRVESGAKVGRVFNVPPIGGRDWVRALRLHQWSKNFLLFVPILAAHQWFDFSRVGSLLLAFLAFGLGASSVYILNDLLDLEADRAHPTKRHRPFASGRIPIHQGFFALALLFLSACLILPFLPWQFAATFGAYYVITLLYSLRWKRVVLMDVFVLTCLYIIRIFAGGNAVDLPITNWLILLSMFIFLSVAFAKRFVELKHASVSAGGLVRGRGYRREDAELVSMAGVTSGLLSVLVLALYINQPDISGLYKGPQMLWIACPLLAYWIIRVWLLAHRGEMNDDPILFALKDLQSWVILAAILFAGVLALF